MKVFPTTEVYARMDEICAILAAGGVVLAPSDTTYGLLTDATNNASVEKLISIKKRPHGKPISVFVSGFEMMSDYVDMSYLTHETKSLLPGPYTLVLPSHHFVSPLLEAEDGTLGVRLIGKLCSSENNHMSNASLHAPPPGTMGDMITTLVTHYGKPLTATSANISGQGLCYSPSAFFHQVSDVKRLLLNAVIDAGELPHHLPSTVIHLGTSTPRILRANDTDFMNKKVWDVQDVKGQHLVAEEVHEMVRPYVGKMPVVFFLDGELGCGKTTWTKAFASLFGVYDVVSPTYTYECEYTTDAGNGIKTLKHYDLYNITNAEDMAKLDIAGHLSPTTVVCIEWPGQLSEKERAELARKSYLIRLEFRYTGETTREVGMWWN